MLHPDYEAGSIVNLLSSIRQVLGGADFGYRPLSKVAPKDLAARHMVLIIIDGLGYNYLSNHRESLLNHYLQTSLTSVFPTTTASAITSFYTGVAPQQHAITGWFTWFRELGSVATVLPFAPRHGGVCYTQVGVEPQQLFNRPCAFDDLKVQTHLINPAYITDSAYSRAVASSAQRHPFTGTTEFFHRLRTILLAGGTEQTFTLAYWPQFDTLAHQYGVASPVVANHFTKLDNALTGFLDDIAGSDTTVLVTADHGHIDTQPDHILHLEAHPALAENLALPLCGDPRTAYCYVHAHRREHFEAYVNEYLHSFCELRISQHILEQGYFGLGLPHPRLHERIGDYVLLMKDNYVVSDQLLNEAPFGQIGVHGGLSADELYVPLVVVKP